MIDIREEPIANLPTYATLSIAFEVDRVFDVIEREGNPCGVELIERKLDAAWTKDYDAVAGNDPTRWLTMFDLTNWGMLLAREDGRLVGGAVIAYRTQGVHVLRGRSDLAVLWDIRVAHAERGKGIGKALFAAVEEWARTIGCLDLEIETQNINVGACKFYRRQRCELVSVNRGAYPDFPDEVQLVWGKRVEFILP